MGCPYSLDLRERAVAGVRSGMSCREAAEHFEVSVSSTIRWARRPLACNAVEPKRPRRRYVCPTGRGSSEGPSRARR